MGKRKNGEGSYGTKKIKGILYQYYLVILMVNIFMGKP